MKHVEILLAAYQGEEYLRQQLDSILAQDTDLWHLTVSDDGSSDATGDILDQYAARHPDRIARVRSGRRFGSASAHFYWLLAQCSADWMLCCDQDDFWHADKVRKTLAAAQRAEQENPAGTPLLVFADLRVVDESLQEIAPSMMKMQLQKPENQDYRNILFQNIVTGCTMAVNRSLVQKALQCEDQTQTIMHDWWLALVAAHFGKMIYVPEALISYRQHGRNAVGAQDVTSARYRIYKVTHLQEFQKTVVAKKRQAAVFLKTYQEELTPEECRTLQQFAADHSSPAFKLRYLRWIATPARRLGLLARW